MASFKAEKFTLVGKKLNVGDKAPDFNLVDIDMRYKSLKDWENKIKILSIIPSIDTRVCDIQTKKFLNKYKDDNNIVVLNISVDLPFAFSRWCESNNEKAIALSDYQTNDFGKSYGVLMEPYKTLLRSIFIIGYDNKIMLAEYNDDVGEAVNFDLVFETIEKIR